MTGQRNDSIPRGGGHDLERRLSRADADAAAGGDQNRYDFQ
jgi:hypothetical protein